VSKDNNINPWKDGVSVSIENDPDFIQEITLSPFTSDKTCAKRIKTIKSLIKNKPIINVSSLYKNDLVREKIIIRV
jgi:hypothetical protein